MIIPLLAPGRLLVKAGIRRHVNLASKDRFDARLLRRAVKIDHSKHHSVIRYGRAVHAQLLDSLDIFLDLICPVQQRILRVDMQMYKCHTLASF